VAAARHALAAVQAGPPRRADATEVRVADVLALLVAEQHADGREVERVAVPEPLRGGLDDRVGRAHLAHLGDAEHPLGLVVVGRELALPVRDVRPRGVLVERVERLVERVGVDERAAAHAGAREDERVAQQVDPLDAVAAQPRRPQVVAQVPGVLRELLVGEAAAGLEDEDLVALLREAQRRDAAAEAGSDDDDVVVVLAHEVPLTPWG